MYHVCILEDTCKYIQIHRYIQKMHVLYVFVCIAVHILCISYVSACIFCMQKCYAFGMHRYIQYIQNTYKIHTKYIQNTCRYMHYFLGYAASHIVCTSMYLYVSCMYFGESAYRMYQYVSVCICMYCSHGTLHYPSAYLYVSLYVFVSVCNVCICM